MHVLVTQAECIEIIRSIVHTYFGVRKGLEIGKSIAFSLSKADDGESELTTPERLRLQATLLKQYEIRVRNNVFVHWHFRFFVQSHLTTDGCSSPELGWQMTRMTDNKRDSLSKSFVLVSTRQFGSGAAIHSAQVSNAHPVTPIMQNR